jgi:hypothetical protein
MSQQTSSFQHKVNDDLHSTKKGKFIKDRICKDYQVRQGNNEEL